MKLAQLIKYYEQKLKGNQRIIGTTPNMVKETLKALYELYDYCIDDPTLDEIDMESIGRFKNDK